MPSPEPSPLADIINATIGLVNHEPSASPLACGGGCVPVAEVPVVDEGVAPAPPVVDLLVIEGDQGPFLLTTFTIVVGTMFCCCIICVMRGTGSMPRPMRRVCCVVDG